MSLRITNVDDHVARFGQGARVWQLHEAYQSCSKPPAFVFGSAPDHLHQALYGQSVLGPLRVYDLKDAHVGYEGAVARHGEGLVSLLWNTHVGDIERGQAVIDSSSSAESRRQIVVSDTCVTICGPGTNVWGHWLIDFLPRLHLVELLGIDRRAVKLLLPTAVPPFATALLEAIGIGRDALIRYDHVHETVVCERLLVPSLLRWGNRMHRCFRSAVDSLFLSLRQEEPPHDFGPRLFVERPGALDERSLANIEELRGLAQARGFVSLEPASLTIGQQVAAFSRARQIVGQYGSALHNVLFSRAPTCTCAIRGTSQHPGLIQSGIADALGHDVGYVLGPTPPDARLQEVAVAKDHFVAALDWLDVDAIDRGLRR